MDQGVAALAERQHGVFALRQLQELGFTSAAVRHRVHSCRWEPLGHGTYRLVGTGRTWEQRLMAAVLAAGPGAVASHRSAAVLFRFAGFRRSEAVEITTLRSRRHRDPSIASHQALELPPHHLTSFDGIPVTRTARTLVDLAAILPPARLERAIDNCLATGTVSLPALGAMTTELRRPGRAGIAIMRRLLDERSEGDAAPASELERRFLALVRAAGLEEPLLQFDVGDAAGWAGRADGAYPHLRLLIELDSRRHHMSKLDFEADRDRDNRRVAAGWRPVRFTWDQVTRHPADVIDVLVRSGVKKRRPGDAKRHQVPGR